MDVNARACIDFADCMVGTSGFSVIEPSERMARRVAVRAEERGMAAERRERTAV